MIAKFLTSPAFKFGILPVGSALLGVGLKYVSRNDQYAKFKKEDMAVGLELALTACLMFVVLTTDRAVQLIAVNEGLGQLFSRKVVDPNEAAGLQAKAQLLSGRIADSGWLIALMFLGLICISTVVRKWGWESETEMRPFRGVTLPLVFGILAIIAVMAGAYR